MIPFDDVIADMPSGKRLNRIVTELFMRKRKLNISPIFITFWCYEETLKSLFYYENFK